MKAHLACLRCYRGFLCVLLFAAWGLVMPGPANATGRASFAVAQGTFDVNRATLEVFLLRPGKAPLLLSGGAFRQDSEVTELASDSWTISQEGNQYRVDIKVEDDRLRVSIQASRPASLRWPRLQTDIRAYAIPFGEGSYIPANDPGWLNWLVKRYSGGQLLGELSMPFWTQLHEDLSVTWIVETPFDTLFSIKRVKNTAVPQLQHDFNRLAPDAPFVISIAPGPAQPLYGAGLYRNWLKSNGQFVSLTDKVRAVPQTALLGGAPHIYVWDAGPLKTTDVLNWASFITAFDRARRTPGHLAASLWASFDPQTRSVFDMSLSSTRSRLRMVSPFNQLQLVRAINQGMRQVVAVPAKEPLDGGHDPAGEVLWGQAARTQLVEAFGPYLLPAERWGGGLSVDTVNALKQAGLTRAWLGAKDWLDAFWHPQAVALAKQAGFLVAVYDNYADAHAPAEPETWAAAQMGANLASAGQHDASGASSKGFNGIGVFANPREAQDYARQRIKAVAGAAGLNSYFLDVDAAVTAQADYTPGRETSESENARVIARRLDYPGESLGLVTGSEGAVSTFAANIAYSHGIATQPFDWTDPDMSGNQQSPFFVGQYWPPETPTLFFKTVPIKRQLATYVRSWKYRLPLYQMVLHDSLVSTHHWAYPSLKFSNEQQNTALLQLLYMTPPMYHLNAAVLERDLPFIAAYNEVFSPLHQRLFTQALVDFQVLSADRSLQRTVFDDGTRITVNFNPDNAQSADAMQFAPMSASVQIPGEKDRIIMIAEMFKATRLAQP